MAPAVGFEPTPLRETVVHAAVTPRRNAAKNHTPRLGRFSYKVLRVSGSTRITRGGIALLVVALMVALGAANASAATVIHFQSENGSALTVQLQHHEVHALTFHPTPAPGHVHVSLNDGRHFTVVYPAAAEEAKFVALARADGTPVAVAVAKPKAAAKPAHHTLRYVAAGILVLVIVVVAAVLLVDRRRKLNEEGGGTPPPTQSQPSQ
jgi:hypothetical protein